MAVMHVLHMYCKIMPPTSRETQEPSLVNAASTMLALQHGIVYHYIFNLQLQLKLLLSNVTKTLPYR